LALGVRLTSDWLWPNLNQPFFNECAIRLSSNTRVPGIPDSPAFAEGSVNIQWLIAIENAAIYLDLETPFHGMFP
jgi:hypothetical protein